MNRECSESPTELDARERCLGLLFDDGGTNEEDTDGVGGDTLGGIVPSEGNGSSSCTERTIGERGGGLGGGTGLGDLSGTTVVGTIGTSGCVNARSHERS